MPTAEIPVEAKRLLGEVAAVVGDKLDGPDFLRFAYYYGLRRQQREDEAQEWLLSHRPELAERLLHPPIEEDQAHMSDEGAASAEANVLAVRNAIELADQASKIQARVRGRVSRRRAAERAEDAESGGNRASSMWAVAVAEQKRRSLRDLQFELEMMKRNEAIGQTRLQSENARLDAEVVRLRAEVAQLRADLEAAAPPPPLSTEERLAALNWLVRSKNKPASLGGVARGGG